MGVRQLDLRLIKGRIVMQCACIRRYYAAGKGGHGGWVSVLNCATSMVGAHPHALCATAT